jgi:hypothetical protein
MFNIAGVVGYAILISVKWIMSGNLIGSWDNSNEVLERGKVCWCGS